ncbi:MAG: hypothetical protein AAFP19_10120 [Bacteroidota bacterium]
MDKAIKERQSEVMGILDHYFTRRDLNGEFKTLMNLFFRQQEEVIKKYGFEEQLNDNIRRSMKKQELIELCAIPFLNLELFNAFYDSLPSINRDLLDALIWEEGSLLEDLEKLLEKDLGLFSKEANNNQFYYYDRGAVSVMALFKRQDLNAGWFSSEPKYYLFIPKELRRVISQYYEMPPEAKWLPIEEPEPTQYVYETGEIDIASELPRLRAYEAQGMIRKTGKGRPLAATLGKMQRQLNLNTFFPDAKDKSLKLCRTALLAGMLSAAYKSKSQTDVPLFIRELFTKDWDTYVYSMPIVLHFIKGMNRIGVEVLANSEAAFSELFKEMPLDQWLAFDDFERYLSYNFINLKPIDVYYTNDKLYYKDIKKNIDEYEFQENQSINGRYYHQGIYQPYLKGMLFNFAAFGLLDLAYDAPDVSCLGESYFSPYDGLRYFRINPLGAYIFGRSKTYSPRVALHQTNYTLSASSLMLISETYDRNVAQLAEPFMEQVAPNRFRTSAEIFLKGCKNQQELKQKIQLFKKTILAELPTNWTTFFESLEQKINPLKPINQVRVFQIPEENKDLLQLIIRDPILKKLVYKAEDFHLLVLKKNYPNFRKRLQAFGYLLS